VGWKPPPWSQRLIRARRRFVLWSAPHLAGTWWREPAAFTELRARAMRNLKLPE